MKRTKFLLMAAALLLCVAMPLTAIAAEDIPPMGFMDRLAIPESYAASDDTLIIPETGGGTGSDAVSFRFNNGETPAAEGRESSNIENSPALRINASNTVAANTETTNNTNTTNNANAAGVAGAEIGEQNVPLGNEHPNTGRPLIWMPILGSLMMLGAVPVVMWKKSR